MRERTRVVRFREERREFTPSEEDMGARNEFKDPSGDELSFFLSTPFHSLSLSLFPSKLKRGKNTSLLFLPIFDSALLEIRGGEGEANEIWVCAFGNSRCTVRERTCYYSVERKFGILF